MVTLVIEVDMVMTRPPSAMRWARLAQHVRRGAQVGVHAVLELLVADLGERFLDHQARGVHHDVDAAEPAYHLVKQLPHGG
jgi:hypothetical protein